MSLNELIQVCIAHNLDGYNIDLGVKSFAVNLLKPEMPVISIQLRSLDELLRMMKKADSTHIYIARGVFYLNALYSVTNSFPAARIYYLKTQDLMAVAAIGSFLEEHSVRLPPVNDAQLSQLIDDQCYPERYAKWHTQWEANSRTFKGLLDGRIQNTSVEQGIWLSSNGRCMFCESKTDRMSTATIMAEKGVLVGFQLCGEHETEAMNHPTLFNYICSKTGIPAPFFARATVVLHGKYALTITRHALLKDLDCENEKVSGATITAKRKSGFRVIVRQDALHDYAYIIQDPRRRPVSRIDSANHHHVAYGPDHVHRDLRKANKNKVEPSFTYGFVAADLKAIKKLIENAETQWQSKLAAQPFGKA
ncbi:DUF6516 family protein [Pseudoduganella plicata]|uniref:Uncharacterized protein n=1 Tax=Pseudoduganella plicata TaxID=321984 RepID=A0A4P7BE43_9BURK|nr:DUF6516 family protein [Pseudoduganella plicata]QBQ36961.1 hypothetical protein E1742_12875 [Pseudoduganella plicata]GGZ07977.1 hypothetical protein GCM10007388_46860 [Pseudoduganella plicata]